MTAFEFFSVALSIVLGLGVTRLLSAAVFIFRRRDRIELSWVPFAWATAIFFWQLQYWWSLFDLYVMELPWTPVMFGILLILALLLYAAAALVLPHEEDEAASGLEANFERDGRWALVFLSFYSFLGWIFSGYFFSVTGTLTLLAVALPLLYLAVKPRRLRVVITLLYLVLCAVLGPITSPEGYP